MQEIEAPPDVRKYFWELTGLLPGTSVSKLISHLPPPSVFRDWGWWLRRLNSNQLGPGFPPETPPHLALSVDGKSLGNDPLIFRVEYCLIVQDKAKEFFEKLDLPELHFWPVHLRFSMGRKLQPDGSRQPTYKLQETGYWWMRAGRVLDIIDLDRSDAGVLPPEAPAGSYIGSYERLQMKVERVDEPVFRIRGLMQTFVSDRVARALIDLGLTQGGVINGVQPFFLNLPAVRAYYAAGGVSFDFAHRPNLVPPPSLAP